MSAVRSAIPRAIPLRVVLAGVVLTCGLLLPPDAIVEFLHPVSGSLRQSLLLGATLFKAGLICLGLAIVSVGQWLTRLPASTRAHSTPATRQTRLTLGALLLAALVLRLYQLDSGLWYDEIMTYVRYVSVPTGEILATFDSQNQHFLFSLLAHASVTLWGQSAWSLRLPAVLFGVASIWGVYQLGREVGSAREGLFAAALLTVSYQHVWFSQNARGYSGLLFWTLLSSWLFVRALHEDRPGLWLGYAGAASLGVYTHMTMLFVIIGQFVAYLVVLFSRRQMLWPQRWLGMVIGFGGAGLFTFQLYALVVPQFLGGTMGEQSTVTAWNSPLWTLLELTRGLQVSVASALVVLAGLAVVAAGLWSFARQDPSVVVLALAPVLVCVVATLGLGHPLWPRFFFFAIGFGALVIVRGALTLSQSASWPGCTPRMTAWIGTAVCLALVLAAARSLPYAYGPKQDYTGARLFVESHRETGDVVATVGLAGDPYQIFFKLDWPRIETADELRALRTSARRTWVLYTLPLEAWSVYPEVMAALERDFVVVQEFYGTAGDGTIVILRADNGVSS